MKTNLGQIEKALQQLIEGGTYRLLGSIDAERQLVSKLVSSLEEKILISPDGAATAPHIFSLIVPTGFAADVRANQPLLDELAAALNREALAAGIRFEGQVIISVFPDNTLEPGEFNVQSIWRYSNFTDTQEMRVKDALPPMLKPPKAFLIVQGATVYTIEQDVINIGRMQENDLVIDDPRVSRHHAQLRAVKGRHILFDLDSSGGTLVNNERISQVSLHPGDVILLAGVPLVYGQDLVTNLDETTEYKPPSSTNEESTITVQIKDLNLDLSDE